MTTIAIQVGNSFTCAGYWSSPLQSLVMIQDEEGNSFIPSRVTFRGSSRVIGGDFELDHLPNPQNTIYDIRRLIGRRYEEITEEELNMWPFKLVPNTEGKPGRFCVEVDYLGEKKLFSPEEILAMIVFRMKTLAEEQLGQTIRNAVLSIPSNFNDAQRQAFKDAGSIAGLDVLRLFNESVAAGFSFGKNQREMKTFLFFDLGDATCDANLITIEDGIFEVIATAGDTHLGGTDFTNLLVKHVLASLDNPSISSEEYLGLFKVCEEAKITMSSEEATRIEFQGILRGNPEGIFVTREEFNNLCGTLFARIKEILDDLLRTPEARNAQGLEIVLLGGSCNIPAIRTILMDASKNNEIHQLGSQNSVLEGSATMASILAGYGDPMIMKFLYIDVASMYIGIESRESEYQCIIQRNTGIPCRNQQLFTTHADNQQVILVKVYESEGQKSSTKRLLGEYEISGVTIAPKGIPQIEVTFDLDANGICSLSAVDRGMRSGMISVRSTKMNLSAQEIFEMHSKTSQFILADEARKSALHVKSANK